jgi:hypothetical protein
LKCRGGKIGKNAFAIGLQAPFFMYGILDEIEKKRGKEPVFSAKYRRSTPSSVPQEGCLDCLNPYFWRQFRVFYG